MKSAEVARLLRVHPKQIYRLLDQGLPGRRVGSEWRFLRAEVLAWSRKGVAADAPTERSPREAAATPPPLLAANGDLVIEVLLDHLVREDRPLLGFVRADRGTALSLLASGTILMAGFHGAIAPSHIDTSRIARIHLAEREIGLACPPSMSLRSIVDIARKRIAIRPETAGVRAHFDEALKAAKKTLSSLRATSRIYTSHCDVVCAIARGEADVGLTTAGWAARLGLHFLPLKTESYDLLLFAENLGTPHAVAVCEIAQSSAFRKALASLSGYRTSNAGAIRYERDNP
jgi:excisionase family DNA binding protein